MESGDPKLVGYLSLYQIKHTHTHTHTQHIRRHTYTDTDTQHMISPHTKQNQITGCYELNLLAKQASQCEWSWLDGCIYHVPTL